MTQEQEWTKIIRPRSKVFYLNLREVWQYRDLLEMFVKRDIVTIYKQTILGPIWYIVQPILTTAIYVLVFGNIAKISTDGLPQILFYFSGIVVWNLFAQTFNGTSDSLKGNAGIFGKVYFPRLISPLSKVVSGLIRFFIQFIFLIGIFAYFKFKDANISFELEFMLFPIYLLLLMGIGLGGGLLFSSFTTKYRDLGFLVGFGIQLLMYASPVIYPASTLEEKYKWIFLINPLAPVIEAFRYSLLGTGDFSYIGLGYSLIFCITLLLIGMMAFNKAEKKFMDTV